MIKLSACQIHQEYPPADTASEAARIVRRLRREGAGDSFIANILATAWRRPMCCPAGAYAQEIVLAAWRVGDLYVR